MELISKKQNGNELAFQYNDGGRSKYYKATNVGDCVCRAITIASGKDYKEIYSLLRKESKESPRSGVRRKFYENVISKLGGKWNACMTIGSGCQTHLRVGEVPMSGRIICRLSHHLVAIVDGVINDTYDCSREADRCVYGYWEFK